MMQNEDYEKISKLRYRDRITNGDINFIQSMHSKYCSSLKKNICWQCPNSIREAMFDLFKYIEKNPLKNESENTTIIEPSGSGEGDKQISGRGKTRRPSNGDKK